jgi:hypothetical protein
MPRVVVTVLFQGDAEVARLVEAEHAAAHRAVLDTARRHGLRSHRRVYGSGEFLDIDEWDTVEGRLAFLEEAAPHLRELGAARGTPPPVSKVWYPGPDEGGTE